MSGISANSSVFQTKTSAIRRILGRNQAVIGVIHARPLPGSPHYDGEAMAAV